MATSDLIWYYQVAGETVGPFTARQMRQFANDGTIDRFTLVRRNANGDWVSAESVKGLNFEATAAEPINEFDYVPTATFPPVVPATSGLPTVAVQQVEQPRRHRITVDTVLFTWTRIISYFMIAGLLLMGLGYSIIFLLNMRPSQAPQTVSLSELRETKAAAAPVEDASDSRTTTILGIDIGPSLQKLVKSDPQMLDIIGACLRVFEPEIQAATLNHLETFAAELESGNLKPMEKRKLLEKFLFKQPFRITEYQSELQDKASARSDAVTKVLAAVGLSILVCLVLVLLGIERNTRDS